MKNTFFFITILILITLAKSQTTDDGLCITPHYNYPAIPECGFEKLSEILIPFELLNKLAQPKSIVIQGNFSGKWILQDIKFLKSFKPIYNFFIIKNLNEITWNLKDLDSSKTYIITVPIILKNPVDDSTESVINNLTKIKTEYAGKNFILISENNQSICWEIGFNNRFVKKYKFNSSKFNHFIKDNLSLKKYTDIFLEQSKFDSIGLVHNGRMILFSQ